VLSCWGVCLSERGVTSLEFDFIPDHETFKSAHLIYNRIQFIGLTVNNIFDLCKTFVYFKQNMIRNKY